jgi:hypothetical protein
MEKREEKQRTTLNKFFGYFIAISAICGSFVLGRSCEQNSTAAQYTKAWADSIKKEAQADVSLWKGRYEQSLRDGERSDEIIKTIIAENDLLKAEGHKAKKSADYWHTQFKQAKEVRDTVTMVSACDSALPRYMEALEYAGKRHENDSLIISIQSKKIAADSALLVLADSTIGVQAARVYDLTNAVKDLNKQKKRQKFWRWAERIGIAVGVAIAVTR